MAFDISLDEDAANAPAPALTFNDFYQQHAQQLADALALLATNERAADKALRHALSHTAQRWRQRAHLAHPEAAALFDGLEYLAETAQGDPAPPVNEATGGYLRGLPPNQAIEALPLTQRAALVTAYVLGWSDADTAVGFSVDESTITTRRRRALRFLEHHDCGSGASVEEAIAAHYRTKLDECKAELPDAVVVRRSGRWREVRNRFGAGFLAAAAIVAGAAIVSSERASPIAEPVEVRADPPSVSGEWLAPVADGRGGFVALNTGGAARFIASPDGEGWSQRALWNSRSVDLRSEVTGFVRSGDYFLTAIESASAIRGDVPLRVARSRNLTDWQVSELPVGDLASADGIRARPEIAAMASADNRVLVTVVVVEDIDHRFFGIGPDDVCAEHREVDRVLVVLCDGQVREVARNVAVNERRSASNLMFLAKGNEPVQPIPMPPGADPHSLVSFGSSFAMIDTLSGDLVVSNDGRTWTPAFTTATGGRFVLLEGSSGDHALVVTPEVERWSSSMISTATGSVADPVPLPIATDPASVWVKPDLAVGPAGWALFVTSSRPWERTGDTLGWAVQVDDWVVSQLPDSPVITAQSVDGSVLVRYRDDSSQIRHFDDRLVLLDPVGDELVEIARRSIDRSRSAVSVDDDDAVKARVYFTPDGVEWEIIWESSDDTWIGSVAVGDEDVLLSGAQLTGGPIRIPLAD